MARDIDLVVDLVSGDVVDKSWTLLAPGGLLASIAAQDVVSRVPQGRRGIFVSNKNDATQLEKIVQQVAAGTLKSTVGEVFSFEDLPVAIERNRTGHAPGKIVADFTR